MRNTNGVRGFRFVLPCLELLEERVVLDDRSAGIRGINSRFLTTVAGMSLTGNSFIDVAGGDNVTIGQIEKGRPNDPKIDTISHPDVRPWEVFFRDAPAAPDSNIESHALSVAGVMIAEGISDTGVARNAVLYASATGESSATEQYVVLVPFPVRKFRVS